MSGLIALLFIFIWGICVAFLTSLFMKKMRPSIMKKILLPIVFILLFIAPVADEIIGGFQFRKLCSENSIVYINKEKAKGRTARYQPHNTELYTTGTVLKIHIDNVVFKDIETGDILISWTEHSSEGGLLMQLSGLLEKNGPITFNGYCAPKDTYEKTFKNLDIKILYK